MAAIKNLRMEIELMHPHTSNAEKTQPMPRMDVCHNCGKTRAGHIENKCLFDSSTFAPRDESYESFRSQFMTWAQGQMLEDALCNIVYELTRGDR